MEATDKVAVTLELRLWDHVLGIMAKSPVPYEITAPLITEVQKQCVAAQQQTGRPTLVEQSAAE